MIILVTGYNAAGKSTYVEQYVKQGFRRINRDEIGGKLDNLPAIVTELHSLGVKKFVLDNTYADIESRKSVIECAKRLKLPIRCDWLDTSFEDAQYNACQRMIRKVGHLMGPEEFKTCKDPNLFPPVALFAYKKRFQKPTLAEGFEVVNRIPFVRKKDPTHVNKALILDYDDCLRVSETEQGYPIRPSDLKILPNRKEKIEEYVKQGYRLLGASNQSGIAKGIITVQQAVDCFEETNRLLGHDIDYFFCRHSVPPVVCYCRKPQVGIFVHFQEKYFLDPAQCIFVGDQKTDETFAARCGIKFYYANKFFK